MARFDGKVCIVTSGGRGIGAETARRYLREGGRVLLCGVNAHYGEATARALGEGARFLETDVRDPAIKRARAEATPLGRVGQRATSPPGFYFCCRTRRTTSPPPISISTAGWPAAS